MIFILLAILFVCSTVCYCLMKVASEADERIEEMDL